MLKALPLFNNGNSSVQGQRKEYKANAVFLFLVPCTHSFLNIHPWHAFIVFALQQGVGPKYKADKNKNTIAQAMCLIVIED